jgi:hypothetical protein
MMSLHLTAMPFVKRLKSLEDQCRSQPASDLCNQEQGDIGEPNPRKCVRQ